MNSQPVFSLAGLEPECHRSWVNSQTDRYKTTLRRQFDAADRQIDQLVYQLYALTPNEIRIVEEATK